VLRLDKDEVRRFGAMEADIKHVKEDVKSILNKLDELDGKFANKWVEKITVGIIIAITGGIGLALITLI